MVKPKEKNQAFYNNQASEKGTKQQNKNWNQPFHKVSEGVSSFNTIVCLYESPPISLLTN